MKIFARLLLAVLLTIPTAHAVDYYVASGDPAAGSSLSSSVLRSEYSAISAAFAKVAPYTSNANKAVVINSGGTAQTVTTGTLALAGNFATTGAFNTTLIQGASVSLTLPLVNGTLCASGSVCTASSFVPTTTTTNGLGLAAANNPAIYANSTKVLSCLSTGCTNTGTLAATGIVSVDRIDVTNTTLNGIINLGTYPGRSGTNATLALNIIDGTSPVGTLANGVTLYSSGGKLWAMDAAGAATKLTP